MGIRDSYKPIAGWSVKEVDAFLRSKNMDDYNLLDVRQPVEYAQGHLPGSVLIPVVELGDRVSELDPRKPTVVYCASGSRSRAAAGILLHAGFREVHNMEGGMNAWEGAMAEGTPEEAMIFFSPAKSASMYICLAWLLEEGTRRFYEGLKDSADSPESIRLYAQLSSAEEHHKATLVTLYGKISGKSEQMIATDCPELDSDTSDIMEGGLRISEWLAWARGRQTADILELLMTLEAISYDRYLYMMRTAEGDLVKEVFTRLSTEEKHHLQALTDLFERSL